MSTDRICAAPVSKKRKAAQKDGGFPALKPIVPACKPRFLLCTKDSKKDYRDCKQVELDITSFVNDDDDYDVGGNEECHTPKGEEHRIPQILSCPLAPRKPRSIAKMKTLEFYYVSPVELQLLFNLS